MKKQNVAANHPKKLKKGPQKKKRTPQRWGQSRDSRKLPTGVPGLDEILGGGIPEFSFNIIAGAPGCGKTTMAHQIVFANATMKNPALYFTVLGEPAIKMLRYQQQYAFFDASKLGTAIRFINLGDVADGKGFEAAYRRKLPNRLTRPAPAPWWWIPFARWCAKPTGPRSGMDPQAFIQRLAQFLRSWQATTFLVGEYAEEEIRDNPIFTVADGLLWLAQVPDRNSVVRKLQIMKLRGQASVPGLHTFRISRRWGAGVLAHAGPDGRKAETCAPTSAFHRHSGTGQDDGRGHSRRRQLLVAGPSGTGKSAMATQFIAEGLRRGEPGIMAIFEERPEGYAERADSFGLDLKAAEQKGALELLYMRPLDLSVDETMQAILDAIKRVGAKRLVIDSLVGFEMALAPGFRTDFRESLYRMIGALTGAGITILSTVEVEDNFTSLQFSHYAISFLTDDIIRLRYVEIDGQLRKMMVVIKMRGGNHSKDIREYVITDKGVVVIHPRRTDYAEMSTGIPHRTGPRKAQENEAAPEPKASS